MGMALNDTCRLRVLWVTIGLGRGGTERLLVDTVTRFDASRYDVEVAYVLPWKDALVPELTAHGTRVTCVGTSRAPLDPRWILRLARLVRRGGWDVVHTQAPLPAVVARLARRRETALVHSEHNTWDRYRRWTRAANAATIGRNQHVFAVSAGVARSMRGVRDVEVLVQGLPPARAPIAATRATALARLGLDGRRKVVGSVGNLVAKKDHATLLDAAELLADAADAPDVVIIGGGPLEDELRARAARGTGRVRVLGSRDDVTALLPALSVFVLSSRFEGLPIAMLEAMAAGVPVVATAVGGIPEVVREGVEGFLVPPADPVALADAIGKVLADDALGAVMGAAAAARAAQFDLRRAIDRTAAVYDEIGRRQC